MIGNIAFKKKWEDQELIELEVYFKSKHVILNHMYYTTKTKINQLHEDLSAFIEKNILQLKWSSGNGNYEEVPQFSLTLVHIDNRGHIAIEVKAEVDDEAPALNYHECSFCIYSELGLILKFQNSLSCLV